MSERESQQHEWTFFRQHSSGNTTDAYDYCSRCGAIRARYFWKDKDGVSRQADPQYFGVGIEDHTTNQPLCLALLAPEPEPEPLEHWSNVMVGPPHKQLIRQYKPVEAPEPEPSDAEIEAGAKALCRLAWGDAERTMSAESWAVYRDRAKTVLLAARAARQTGGE